MKPGDKVNVVDESYVMAATGLGFKCKLEGGGYLRNRNPWIFVSYGTFPTDEGSSRDIKNDACIMNPFSKEVVFIRSSFLIPTESRLIDGRYCIAGSRQFTDAVKSLSEGHCDAIYGPSGGILVLDDQGCLVTRSKTDTDPLGKIYFSAQSYLGTWRLLKEVENPIV